jgi:hypothetical protein
MEEKKNEEFAQISIIRSRLRVIHDGLCRGFCFDV